jgi:hypothetical protein
MTFDQDLAARVRAALVDAGVSARTHPYLRQASRGVESLDIKTSAALCSDV